MAKKLVLAILTAASPVVFAVTAAHAGDPGFCRNYAHAAINQVRGALAHPRCLPGMKGTRWSADESVHYNWCLGASFAAAGSERDARTAYLRGCAM